MGRSASTWRFDQMVKSTLSSLRQLHGKHCLRYECDGHGFRLTFSMQSISQTSFDSRKMPKDRKQQAGPASSDSRTLEKFCLDQTKRKLPLKTQQLPKTNKKRKKKKQVPASQPSHQTLFHSTDSPLHCH